MSSEPVDVKLATYMERLDRYIETQSALNVKLADGLEKINTEATSKREIEMKKHPFLSVWPELGE